MGIDKEALLKDRLNEAEVEVPGIGTVRVRGLSRGEVISMQKATDNEHTLDGPRVLVIERKMIALGMIEPQLTEDEVKQWQKAAPANEIDPVMAKISELSGLDKGAGKAAMRSFRDGPGSGIRDVPSAEAVDDGGTPAPGDE